MNPTKLVRHSRVCKLAYLLEEFIEGKCPCKKCNGNQFEETSTYVVECLNCGEEYDMVDILEDMKNGNKDD